MEWMFWILAICPASGHRTHWLWQARPIEGGQCHGVSERPLQQQQQQQRDADCLLHGTEVIASERGGATV